MRNAFIQMDPCPRQHHHPHPEILLTVNFVLSAACAQIVCHMCLHCNNAEQWPIVNTSVVHLIWFGNLQSGHVNDILKGGGVGRCGGHVCLSPRKQTLLCPPAWWSSMAPGTVEEGVGPTSNRRHLQLACPSGQQMHTRRRAAVVWDQC